MLWSISEVTRHPWNCSLLCKVLTLFCRLGFGANARKASERDSETGMHVVAQYGELSFLKLLLEYGADINAVLLL